MGLFSKKKKIEFPSLPEFSEIAQENLPEFPAYEPTISEIKEEVGKPEIPEFRRWEIPKREKKLEGKKFMATGELGIDEEEKEEKPLYIKVEQYKAALEDLEALKTKITEADAILSELEDLKAQEDKKLEDWKTDIQNLKERLLSIDENLFES